MQLTKPFCIASFIIILSACRIPSQLDQDRAAAARLELGLAYLEQARNNAEYLEVAYHNLQLAKKYSPNNAFVLFGFAQFYHQVGENKIADGLYKQLVSQHPEQGYFSIYYGKFLCQIGHYKKAQHYFDQAKNLNHYKWKVEAIEQSAYCAVFQQDIDMAKIQFSALFLLAPAKRDEVKKTMLFYKKKGLITNIKGLSTIIQ